MDMTADTVLDIFRDITRIPRESGHEGPMTAFLQEFAAKRSLECRTDKTGNVVIVKEAAPGKEKVPTLVLQAHQDMVCEKNADFDFDFLTQAIPYEVEDGWMVSKNTTLGADDGIGIAACLALLDSDLPTGKLECLFTISEETGMDGAFALEPGFFEGKTLINLDSEDEGQLFVGCAGGMDTTATFEFKREALRKGYRTLKIRVTGGRGGHSGDDINKERANALRLLIRFLYTELQYDFQLLSIDGGNKPNAICREAEAVIAVPAADIEEWKADAEAFESLIQAEYKSSDPDIKVVFKEEASLIRPIEEGDAANIIMTLLGVPHGVEKMSMDIPWTFPVLSRPPQTWPPRTSKAMSSRSSRASGVPSSPNCMRWQNGWKPPSSWAPSTWSTTANTPAGSPTWTPASSKSPWTPTSGSSIPIRRSRPSTPASSAACSWRSSRTWT